MYWLGHKQAALESSKGLEVVNKLPKVDGKILVADDDPVTAKLFVKYLETSGYETVTANDGRETLDLLADDIVLVLLDLEMPRVSGMECLSFIKENHPEIPVLVISGTGGISDAVAAIQTGAIDYITKPAEREEILARVQQALKLRDLTNDNKVLRAAVSSPMLSADFIAESAAAKALVSKVSKVCQLDSTVLITGESGTGKSTVARMIHQSGVRSKGPFVTINCSSLPRELLEAELFGHTKGAFTGAVGDRPGRAEIADGGTLFLDEIGDMPLELQPKLLTFLQDRTFQRIGSNSVKKVDVRVIAATHQDLAEMCENKNFREDLFFRLNVIALHMPSLRNRREDIPEIVSRILERGNRQSDIGKRKCTSAALQKLSQHNWRGNIRELENVLERASAFCEEDTIDVADLTFSTLGRRRDDSKEEIQQTKLFGKTLEEIEKLAIVETLEAVGGNKAEAARRLGISEKGMYNKLKRHEITKTA